MNFSSEGAYQVSNIINGGMAGKLLKATSLSDFRTPSMKYLERKKQVIYEGLGIRMTLNFLTAVWRARTQ